MNLLGVIAAILLLMILIYKKVSLLPATICCVMVLAFSNGIPFMELTMDHYAVSLADFIRKYFMVFASNALFGKIMEETLLATQFSRMMEKIFGEKNAVFGAMMATALLSFGGVSVFVIVFTVYPIFLMTFRKADLPRKLIPACIMSSSCTFPLSMLPGGAQLNNIIPGQYIGTTPMAALPIGLICSAICMTFLYLYFKWEFKKAAERGEHFENDGKTMEAIQKMDRETGIKSWVSPLPLVLIIVLINGLKMDLSIAVLCACVLAVFLGRKNLSNLLDTVNGGLEKVGGSMVTTAVSVGFGGAVLACSGAEVILGAIKELPFHPVILLSIASGFAGLLTGNGGGGCDVAMNLLAKDYLAMGVAPQLLHRVVAIATAAFSCLPHNGMLITIMKVCGFEAKQAYKYIFWSTVINGAICLVAADLLGMLFY